MIKKYILCGLILCVFCTSYAQTDSIKTSRKLFLKKEIVPLSLIGAGIYVNYANGSLGKVRLQDNIQRGLNFRTRADDFLQFAPIGVLGLADVLGLKTANNIKIQTKNIVLITAANYVIVKTLKIATNETRPNGSKHSFPSGHTSQAFAMAGILRHELKESYPVLSYSGYLFATTTGAFRVLNNKHWVSDVLVGAGVGMLVSDVFYRIQNKHSGVHKRENKITTIFVPTFKEKSLGVSGILYF
ncbi:MAG: phosphatase PAP2 family protein [Flavobacteriaceae bacterium]|nr:phosphatase PAP2 family protein [Flavobacteriaceae bacterium]